MAADVANVKHDADQAGGAKEVVFSSDGDDAMPVTFPIPLTTQNENLVESEIMTAEEAFEVFAGKLYIANPYSSKKAVATEDSNESPLERLGRLKRELDELETDCQSKVESPMFEAQLSQLQDQLQRLSTTQLQQPTLLSESIQAAMADLNTNIEISQTDDANDKASGTALQLEARLRRIEMAMGSFGSSSEESLLDRVLALENMQAKLDDKKLDLLQKRGKVIRQDLEAAAKARNKLASTLVSAEDSKTIAALYDQLLQLQGLSPHLPALTQRLQELAHQHVDASTRAARFQAIEQVVGNLSLQVQSMDTALEALDKSLKQNATAMQESVAALEERIKVL
jgi:DNA repair exonuclease SbcCD ATPase subunit